MAKKSTKKQTKKANKITLIKKEQNQHKLKPGRKLCKRCGSSIGIHRRVCTDCGHVHQMKKKKQQIIKSLNKVTPILIKSIIENNDFNEPKSWKENVFYNIGLLSNQKQQQNINGQNLLNTKAQLKQLSRKKSNPRKALSGNQNMLVQGFKPTNNASFQHLKFKRPVSCISSSKNWLVICQNVSKNPINLSQKQQLTISAYKLQQQNLIGVSYKGQSILHFSFTTPQNTQAKNYKFKQIQIKYYISKIKIFSNLVICLTGESSLIILSLPSVSQTNNQTINSFTLIKNLQIKQNLPDRITSFQFLRGTLKQNKDIYLVVGTYFGRITVYNINQEGYKIVRYVPTAHRQMITTISQCPLNNKYQEKTQQNYDNQTILFATGSYDGTLAVWDLHQQKPIFQYECTNRKIWSIHWDPGAKFLFVNRDQTIDPCIILCFYSINKIQQYIHLSSTVQTRTVKTHKYITMAHHDFYSKYLPVLDPVRGILKMLYIEQLRGNSLKKKKLKKDENCQIYYKIIIKDKNEKNEKNNQVEIEQLGQGQMEKIDKNIQKNEQKKFPAFSGVSIQTKQGMQFVYLSTLSGNVIVFKNMLKSQ